MPYIDPTRRIPVQARGAETPGELNYLFTMAAKAYLQKKGASYTTMNDILGAFEGAKLEFYRRMVAPYEAEKRVQNGDVYP